MAVRGHTRLLKEPGFAARNDDSDILSDAARDGN
jgi:hypothetical protein